MWRLYELDHILQDLEEVSILLHPILPLTLLSYPNLAALLSDASPTAPLPSFWKIFESVIPIGGGDLKYDKLMVREMQKKMVMSCHDYDFAMDAWGLLLVPLLLGLPRVGNITTSTRNTYSAMASPVMTGTSIYVDTNTCILSLGELTNLPLSGVRTSKGDVGCNASKYLNFQVSDPCTIFVCWPENSRISKWLAKRGFFLTTYKVTTSSSTMIVFAKQYNVASMVTLGGCANSISKYDNYFILLSKSFYPSYAKMKSEEFVRFQLSRDSTHLASDTGNLKYDLSIFQWSLHVDTSLVVDSSTHSQLTEVENLSKRQPTSPTQEIPLAFQCRTRNTWEISANLREMSLHYNDQSQGVSLIYLQIQNVSLAIQLSLTEGKEIISRLNSSRFRLDFELSLKTSGCPHLPSPESSPLECNSDTQLSTSMEYIIEPTFINLGVNKDEGRSKLIMDISSQSHINLNLSPMQLYLLIYFSRPLFRLLSNHGAKSDEAREERSKQCQKLKIVNIVMENQLGQDIQLKMMKDLEYDRLDDEEDERRVFHCTVSSGCAVKLGVSIHNPVQNLAFNVDTDGWYPIIDIPLSSRESLEVFELRPILSKHRASSCASDEWGDEVGSTWQNSTPETIHSRSPFSKKLSFLLDDFATGTFNPQECFYGMTVKSSPSTSVDTSSCQSIVDCGLIFRNEVDSDIESDGETPIEQIQEPEPSYFVDCTLYVILSSNVYLVNSAECSLSVDVADDHDEIAFEMEAGDVYPLPLQALHPTKSSFTLQKIWGLDKWLPEPFEIHVTGHSFNIHTPPRLRISRDQENESIWISSLKTPSLFPGSSAMQTSHHENILPVDDIDENSTAESEKELEIMTNQFEDQVLVSSFLPFFVCHFSSALNRCSNGNLKFIQLCHLQMHFLVHLILN
jgi:hypothetical protein